MFLAGILNQQTLSEMSIYLVTGGAGFIGSNIAERLVRLGRTVRVLDNFSTGKRENLSAFWDRIEVLEGDIADLSMCKRAVLGVKYVLHQAALPSVPRSVKDPIATNNANVVGTLNMLQVAREAGVKRFVYASSSSVYGDSEVLPKLETMAPAPLSPYAVSKLAGEYYCRVFFQLFGLETVSLRYFNVFGPRQDPTSHYAAVVPKFVAALLQGEAPQIYGDGEQTRDFTFVENVVDANLAGTEAPNCAGSVFNIACGTRITVNRLAELLGEYIGVRVPAVHIDRRPGDVMHSLADIGAARDGLGYEARIGVEDGLRTYCKRVLDGGETQIAARRDR